LNTVIKYFFVWQLVMELPIKHQYRRHFQGCHDRRKVAKSERYTINRKYFYSKNYWPGCPSWLQYKRRPIS